MKLNSLPHPLIFHKYSLSYYQSMRERGCMEIQQPSYSPTDNPLNFQKFSCGTDFSIFTQNPQKSPTNIYNNSPDQISSTSLLLSSNLDHLPSLYQVQTNHQTYEKISLRYWWMTNPFSYLNFDTSYSYETINTLIERENYKGRYEMVCVEKRRDIHLETLRFEWEKPYQDITHKSYIITEKVIPKWRPTNKSDSLTFYTKGEVPVAPHIFLNILVV